jgi:hypothetical protein
MIRDPLSRHSTFILYCMFALADWFYTISLLRPVASLSFDGFESQNEIHHTSCKCANILSVWYLQTAPLGPASSAVLRGRSSCHPLDRETRP